MFETGHIAGGGAFPIPRFGRDDEVAGRDTVAERAADAGLDDEPGAEGAEEVRDLGGHRAAVDRRISDVDSAMPTDEDVLEQTVRRTDVEDVGEEGAVLLVPCPQVAGATE